jgi:hypothetical protein
MAEKSDVNSNTKDVPGLATVVIPEHLAQEVVEFVAKLEAGDTDVSGYMLNLGLGLRTFAESTQTLTNCKNTNGGKDELCDNDTYIDK